MTDDTKTRTPMELIDELIEAATDNATCPDQGSECAYMHLTAVNDIRAKLRAQLSASESARREAERERDRLRAAYRTEVRTSIANEENTSAAERERDELLKRQAHPPGVTCAWAEGYEDGKRDERATASALADRRGEALRGCERHLASVIPYYEDLIEDAESLKALGAPAAGCDGITAVVGNCKSAAEHHLAAARAALPPASDEEEKR